MSRHLLRRIIPPAIHPAEAVIALGSPHNNKPARSGRHNGASSYMAKEHIPETLDLGVTDPSKTAEARQDRHFEGKLDWIVFGFTSLLAIAFVLWGFLNQVSLASSASSAQSWVILNFGWFFVLTSSLFVVFVLWLCLLYTSPSPRDQRGSRMPSSA